MNEANKESEASEPVAESPESRDLTTADAASTDDGNIAQQDAPEDDKQDAPEDDKPSKVDAKPERPPLPPLPEAISINEFREKPLSEIYSMLEVLPVKIPANASKSQLVFDLVSFYAKEGVLVEGEGVMEQAKDNYAMLRDPAKSFKTSPDDLYLQYSVS